MQILNLFPTPVWAKQLSDAARQEIDGGVLTLLERLEPRTLGPGPGDLQTDNDLQHRPEMAPLIREAEGAVGAALETLQIEHRGFEITGCWVNVRARGGSHRSHSHPNNYLSGVYYVRLSSEGGRLMFHDPRIQTNIIRPRVNKENPYNSRIANVPIVAGALIVFPAWLSHSVEVNQSDERRISVSFNAMFSQFAERLSQPIW